MNPEIKSIFLSKTLWGVLVAALPTVLGLFGYKVADVAAFSAGADSLVDSGITLAGLALAAYGRFKATAALVVK